MSDIIKLLPDSIANQIAAGEVIQRPASVVKELMENAIDAGATNVKLIIKDAGKTLIQVIDDGKGMSETDARMCFERHATSKIQKAEDLFLIRTMGFRGEAMASIAAIAQVELKTKQAIGDLGTRIVIEGSEVKRQEACHYIEGTSISVKNLFFNVPARRNFLKSNPVEMRHILDEFQRIALANANIFFSLHHNKSELFHLPKGNLRQRVVGIFGQAANKKLVPVNEETDILKIKGYVGKPEFAKKTRGEQFFFVNNRFIKSGYLNHAIIGAYEEVLPKDTYPLYVLFIEIDPARIDINVHPTKQEIKFEDERITYNYLKVAVRHALGQYSVTPTLNFDQLPAFSSFNFGKKTVESTRKPMAKTAGSDKIISHKSKRTEDTSRQESNKINWRKLYEGLDEFDEAGSEPKTVTIQSKWTNENILDDENQTFSQPQTRPYQIHNTYIVSQIKSGFLLIDQHIAHQRILYEKYIQALNKQEQFTQRELFPETIQFSPSDANLLTQILPEINFLGFKIEEFGKHTFIIHGIPAEFKHGNLQKTVETLLEQYKSNIALRLNVKDNLARTLAKNAALKRGKELSVREMSHLFDQLFACQIPQMGPMGKPCFITFTINDLQKRFE